MSAESLFLQTIREHPEDDLPRLVFADWLDEENQPERAEFIRVQCELSKIPETDPRWHTLKARSDELQAIHRRDWVGPLDDLFSDAIDFRRGFVDHVNIGDSRLKQAILPLLRAAFSRNAISNLEYSWSTGGFPDNRVLELLREMMNWPEIRSLRELEISYYAESGGWQDDEIDHLSRNPHLSKLESLKLGAVSPDRLARLGRGTFASSLSNFHAKMDESGEDQKWCRVWKQLPFLSRLVELDFGIDSHTDDTIAELLEADLPNVQSVKLNCNDITEEIFSILGRWPRLRQIQKLDLHSNNLGSRFLSHLAMLPTDSLRVLQFGGELYRARARGIFLSQPGSLDPDSIARFVRSPLATQLTDLQVTEIASGGTLLREMSNAPFHALSRLNLWQVECDPSDYEELFSADWFSHLRNLRISLDGSTDAEVEIFLHCPLHPEATLSLYFGYSTSRVSAELKMKLRERYGSRIQITPD